MADLFETVLQEAGFEGIVFPVTECHSECGHDAVEHTAYLRRGSDIEPTGQQSYKGGFTIPLINGLTGWGNNLFPGKRADLIAAFESTPIGQLQHPTLGTFPALIKSWKEKLDPDVRNGSFIDVEWVEHTGSAFVLIADANSIPTDEPTAVENAASAADTAMADFAPDNYRPVSPTMSEKLDYLEEKQRNPAEIESSIRTMLQVVDNRLASPSFEDADAHDVVMSLETLKSSILSLKNRYYPQNSKAKTYKTSTYQSVWQIALEVYGAAYKGSLLLTANAVPDPLFIPPNTTLVIPSGE